MEVDGDVPQPNPTSNGKPKRNPRSKKEDAEREGHLLLGFPTFTDIGNGRLRCVETGHELPSREKDSYSRSKGCRLALIDAAVAGSKPPLNMFKLDPLSKSKLVCKLTGDTINKAEEHIWKHINGKRFLNKLEEKELSRAQKAEEDVEKVAVLFGSDKVVSAKKDKKKTKKKGKKHECEGNGSLVEEAAELGSDFEELDFWFPPVGSRWDFDDGKDRWASCESVEPEVDDDSELGVYDKENAEAVELSMRPKRMAMAVGPSSFASRKKKIKKTHRSTTNV